MGKIKGTEKSTKSIFNPLRGSIKILVRPTMKFAKEFYPPIIKLLKEHSEAPTESTNLFIDLEYYNNLSSRDS